MPTERFGKYALLHKLAMGGMGEVWLARQSGPAGFDRFVAVKRLLPNLAANDEFVQMFLDEARLVARVNHPHVCQVFEFGQEQGSYYLAMEYLHGESLASLLQRSVAEPRPLGQGLVAFIVAQALEGLHFAHEVQDGAGRPLGLVHRDISPSNIFVTYSGQVKLLDFGIAKAAHRQSQTVAGAIKGKFGYVAPEAYRGQPLDRRADLFAMGVVLWEMLTRRRLYKRSAEYEILRAIVEEPPPDPRRFDAALGPELALAALRALEKDPAKRFQTALEMRRAMSAFLRTLPEEVDAQTLASAMADLYGRVWIDLRSSLLESWKSGSLVSADAELLSAAGAQAETLLSAGEMAAAGSGQMGGLAAAGGAPARLATPPSSLLASGSGAARAALGFSRLPPAPVLQPATPASYLIGSAATLIALISVAALAAYQHQPSEPLPVAPSLAPAERREPPASAATAASPEQPVRPALSPSAQIEIAASPRSALVQLDDGGVSSVPLRLSTVAVGRHTLILQAPGYRPRTVTLEVAGGVNRFDYALAPLPSQRAPSPAHPPHRPPKSDAAVVDTDGLLKAF